MYSSIKHLPTFVRSLLMGALLIFLLPSQVEAQNKSIEKVKSTLHAQSELWNKGDIEGFMEYYWKSDQLQFIGSNGITKGWQATLERYQKSYPDAAAMGKLRFEILDVTQRSRKVISLVGKFYLSREMGDLEGTFLLIWKKVKGKWVIVSDFTA
ncbi:MAG: nuclear transport factor 2 family protein [Bacteroidota bacterium]